MKFCLAFQREALSVPVTRRVLGDVLRTVGVDDDSISDILLAATEACSNVLRHGGPRATGYAVVVTIGADRCEVEVAEDWSSAGPGAVADVPRRAAGSGGRRLSRPSQGLTMPGGRRRAGGRALRRVTWRRAARGPRPRERAAQGRGEARRPGRAADVDEPARIGPRAGRHAGLRRRRDAAQPAGPRHGGDHAQADQLVRRRSAGPDARRQLSRGSERAPDQGGPAQPVIFGRAPQ